MGKLTYDSTLTADFDDRILAHIQVVVGAKLRRGESFYFTWRDDPQAGDGRSTIWLHPSIPISFKYFGSRSPSLNREWVEALMATANSSRGLQLVAEPTSQTSATKTTGTKDDS
ncbi:MAG: ATP-dependent DNA ligase [Cryobacterium sp.]